MPDVDPIESVADGQARLRRVAADLDAVSAWFGTRKWSTNAQRWGAIAANLSRQVREVASAARRANDDDEPDND